MKKEPSKKAYWPWLTFAIWLMIWFAVSHLVGSSVILPSPRSTILALIKLVGTSDFYLNVLWTVIRTVLGIVLSFGLGAGCAVLAKRSSMFREFLRLPVSFFKSIPVMAIVIYVILVVKSNWVAVIVCFLMCFPIAYTNILNGLEAMDRELIELGRTLGLSGRQMIRYIMRPALDSEIKTALGLIASMSWKVVVASEVLAIPKFSIGYQMLNSKYYLETPDLFAYMIVLIVLSLLMEKLVSCLTALKPERLGRTVEKDAADAGIIEPVKDPEHIIFSEVSKTFVNEDGTVSKALDDLSLDFGPGVTAVLGPSGYGKTTMARLITGLERPDTGSVKIGEDVRIGYLFQEDRLLPWLSVRDNMLLALAAGNCTGLEAEKAVEEMAEKLEIKDALGMMPAELSGGMAHRTALGRTLLYGGNILILDEPFRGLDEELRTRVVEVIGDDIKPDDRPKTVIMITHDEDLAAMLADRVVRI